MSLTRTVSVALSGLAATSRSAQVVSSNIANANTPGYGVRNTELSTFRGAVRASVTRDSDPVILASRRSAEASLGDLSARADAYSRLEDIIGLPGDGHSLTDRIGTLDTAFLEAASQPNSDVRLGKVAASLNDVSSHLNDVTSQVQRMRQEADASIAVQVDRLNSALAQLETVNSDIANQSANMSDTSDLLDQRQGLIDQISAIVPVQEYQRPSGKVALVTLGGAVLIDDTAKQLEFNPTTLVTAELSVETGTLSQITLDGQTIDASVSGGKLSGGSLSGAFAVRDEITVEVQGKLDDFAEDLLGRFQGSAVDPTLAAGDLGLFTDGGGAFTAPDNLGLAGRIAVNPSYDTAQGGELRLLRDGLGSITPGPIADGTQLNAWRDALQDPLPQPDGSLQDGDALAASLVSLVGGKRSFSEIAQSYASSRADSLRAEELRGGVDTDAELQKLLVIEQAYAANARVLEVANEMLRRVMEI